jgi:hypothetical protein
MLAINDEDKGRLRMWCFDTASRLDTVKGSSLEAIIVAAKEIEAYVLGGAEPDTEVKIDSITMRED